MRKDFIALAWKWCISLLPYSIGQNSVTWPPLAAEEVRKCSPICAQEECISIPLQLQQITTHLVNTTLLTYRFGGSKSWNQSVGRDAFPLEVLEDNLFLCLFQLLETACIPCLMTLFWLPGLQCRARSFSHCVSLVLCLLPPSSSGRIFVIILGSPG